MRVALRAAGPQRQPELGAREVAAEPSDLRRPPARLRRHPARARPDRVRDPDGAVRARLPALGREHDLDRLPGDGVLRQQRAEPQRPRPRRRSARRCGRPACSDLRQHALVHARGDHDDGPVLLEQIVERARARRSRVVRVERRDPARAGRRGGARSRPGDSPTIEGPDDQRDRLAPDAAAGLAGSGLGQPPREDARQVLEHAAGSARSSGSEVLPAQLEQVGGHRRLRRGRARLAGDQRAGPDHVAATQLPDRAGPRRRSTASAPRASRRASAAGATRPSTITNMLSPGSPSRQISSPGSKERKRITDADVASSAGSSPSNSVAPPRARRSGTATPSNDMALSTSRGPSAALAG